MGSQLQQRVGWTNEVEQGVPSGLGSASCRQPWGNAATAAAMGLGGTSSAWSPDEVSAWVFGEDEDAAATGFGGGLLDEAKRTPDAVADARRRLDFEPPKPSELVGWVDTVIPPGTGVALTGEIGALLVAFKLEEAASAKVVNEGGGWFAVEASGALAAGVQFGEAFKVPGTGESADGKVLGGGQVTRSFRVPWSQLNDLQALAATLSSALVGEMGDWTEQMWPPELVELLVGGHDLTPYLTKEEVQLTGEAEIEAELSGLGEELSASLAAAAGLVCSIEYEADEDRGVGRKGTIKIGGKAEEVAKLGVDLSKTLGVDTDCILEGLSDQVCLAIPFTELDGDKTFGEPYVEGQLKADCGPVGATFTVEEGAEVRTLEVAVAIDPGSAAWQKVLDEVVGETLEIMTAGIVELETSGTLTMSATFDLSDPALSDIRDIGREVATYLRTGAASPALTPALDAVDRAVAKAELALEADLTLIGLRAAADAEVEAGIGAGIEGEGQVSLVYQRDDLYPELKAPPTVDDLVAFVRGGAAIPGLA